MGLECLATQIKTRLQTEPLFQEDPFTREFTARYHLTARTRPLGELEELERVEARLAQLQRDQNLTAYKELAADMKKKADTIASFMQNLFDDDQFVARDTVFGELIIFGQGDDLVDSDDMDKLLDAAARGH